MAGCHSLTFHTGFLPVSYRILQGLNQIPGVCRKEITRINEGEKEV